MLTYIAVILTVHTLVGIINFILAILAEMQRQREMQHDAEMRDKLFSEIMKESDGEKDE